MARNGKNQYVKLENRLVLLAWSGLVEEFAWFQG